ncbi:MAG TPA: hypothetical protein VLT92_00115 [Burkholderiales bacterium]|nr:hypothetical protein [Burkholderiales bacterium]
MEYPFTKAPQAGTVQEVAPGIYWVRMPLPFALTPWITKSEYLLAHAYYHRIGGTDYAALAALHERHGEPHRRA